MNRTQCPQASAPARRSGPRDRISMSALIALGFGAALLLPALATAQESKTDKWILGFTKDQKQMLVKMDDINTGLSLRLYDVETGLPAAKSKLTEYSRGEEIETIKAAKKRFKIVDEAQESMKNVEETIAFFGVEKGDNLVIAATDYKRLGKVMAVPLKVDPESKAKAQARLRTIVWSSDRKTMVLVVNQKLVGDFLHEKDYFHLVTPQDRKIQWIEQDKPKEEKPKEEKKEDKGWWPF